MVFKQKKVKGVGSNTWSMTDHRLKHAISLVGSIKHCLLRCPRQPQTRPDHTKAQSASYANASLRLHALALYHPTIPAQFHSYTWTQ